MLANINLRIAFLNNIIYFYTLYNGLGMKISVSKYFFYIVFITFISFQTVLAQETWICPGVKLGYRFDDGFVIGFEVSYVRWGNGGSFGWVLAYDYCSKTRLNKFNVSVEGGSIIGAAIGPSFIIADSANSFGITTTVYGGYVAMPYLNYD